MHSPIGHPTISSHTCLPTQHPNIIFILQIFSLKIITILM